MVNEPGSWNFSGLHTADPDAAAKFHGALFGGVVEPADPEMGGTRLIRRPGYGDHLETLQPGIQADMEAMGAPQGFADAVAWMVPLGQDGAPSRWDVTFGVADADEAAARAESLGGTVLMPPTDMPWVRTTVLRDPSGVVFTAGRFVPSDPSA